MFVRKVLICVFAIVAAVISTESAHAQWRSRYLKRDGLFHVERYHTGNGLTSVGAGVLTTLITSAPGIIDSVQGRDLNEPQEESSRAIDNSWKEHYAVEQQSANNLLERTARLVGFTGGEGETENGGGGTKPEATNDRGTQTNEADSGKNPWPAR